jgi:hypothetical protein
MSDRLHCDILEMQSHPKGKEADLAEVAANVTQVLADLMLMAPPHEQCMLLTPKSVEASTKVSCWPSVALAIRCRLSQIGNVPSWKALLRWCAPWIGPVRHHGHVAPPFACLPGARPATGVVNARF